MSERKIAERFSSGLEEIFEMRDAMMSLKFLVESPREPGPGFSQRISGRMGRWSASRPSFLFDHCDLSRLMNSGLMLGHRDVR